MMSFFFLEQCLSACHKPALIAQHHHPIAVNSVWLDQHQLSNGALLADILQRHTHARVLLCGHIHQEIDRYFSTCRWLASPSTCIQFLPNSDEFCFRYK